MSKVPYLILLLLTLLSCGKEIEDPIFGKYQCNKVVSYYDLSTPEFVVSENEIIVSVEPTDNADSIKIDELKVYRNAKLEWSSWREVGDTQIFRYKIEGDSIFVYYDYGGLGGSQMTNISGKKV